MRDHRPTLTEEVIKNTKLGAIQEHAATINKLNNTVLELLPKEIRRYCRVANCRDSQLVLEVANASIMMKLNYDRLYLLSQLRQHGFARLVNIEIKVSPELYKSEQLFVAEKDVPSRPPLSQATADNLTMLAEIAPDNIKQRLRNIAKLANK
ncbi:DUF721 domain-containing protein [Vibrio halioticoli]|uniref:DUF721 domain-containing protein n=1 Tax=Vibrio halioticoli NBRC 102217 TaxID=1219072 RepID=V5FQF3_9VIBR|nr:DciA family protein [Vibrio halioticoli]MPW36850.1 DUF721 domain-containing protein [Vibrio sp. B1Z05]GAD90907.1 hypothetical protein VHA01S_060_00010 [Vibrio halioticoli NBRC 102217]